jgi:myo-inositol 2-dehydrogenase / D-chiro-inositol 1-dehydrogenase
MRKRTDFAKRIGSKIIIIESGSTLILKLQTLRPPFQRNIPMPSPSGITRRSFLGKASTALTLSLASPTVISSTALARPGIPGANDRITIGFIGCGRQMIGKNIPLFMRTPGVEPLAVCDVDSWRVKQALAVIKREKDSGKAKGAVGKVDIYTDYQDLLARDDIDVVCIATPDHWHLKMALDAMAAGKDLALEKPITRTICDSQRLIDAARKYQRVFRVDSEFRSGYPSHRATSLARNGYLGKIVRVDVGVPIADEPCPLQPEMEVPAELDYKRWLGDAPQRPYTEKRVHPRKSFDRPGWFSITDYADGVITNWGAHLNSGAMWATDKERTGPVEVAGTGQFLPADGLYDVLAEFDLNYRFADGLEWHYHTDVPYMKITGEEGWVWADFTKIDAEPKSLLTIELKSDDQQFLFKSEKQNFIDCVRSRSETLEPAEVGHRVNSLGLLGLICIHLGRPLQWDPDAQIFPQDASANDCLDKVLMRQSAS